MIEHSWSPCTEALVAVNLSGTLPEEVVPPTLQSDLSKDEREAKLAEVMDRAMRKVCKCWENLEYAGRGILPSFQPCNQPNNPFNDLRKVNHIMAYCSQ